jgi:hypothetical protein
MHDRAPLQHIRAIGQGQHEIEIMLDDDHRDFPAQAVEGLEQFLENEIGRCGSVADRGRPTAMAVIIPPRSAVNLWLQIGLMLKERRWT